MCILGLCLALMECSFFLAKKLGKTRSALIVDSCAELLPSSELALGYLPVHYSGTVYYTCYVIHMDNWQQLTQVSI